MTTGDIDLGRESSGPRPAGGDGDPPPESKPRGGAHFPCLDAYRGIGMTMVLLNHAAYATGFMGRQTTAGEVFAPLIARLDLSVPMFFVMSGFLLYRPFAGATLRDRPPMSSRLFYRRRVLRIFPAYVVALVGIGLVFGLPIVSVKGWIGNLFLLPAFGFPVEACNDAGVCHVAYGITQAWSIGIEATFYLLLPLYAAFVGRLAVRRSGAGRVVVLLAGLAVLYLVGTAFRAYVVLATPSWAEQSLLWLPMFLDFFAVGMALAVISAAASQSHAVPRVFAWLGDHPNVCWLIALGIFLAVTRMGYPDKPFGLHSTDGSSDYLPRQFAYGIASAVWLAPAIFGDQSVGVLRRMLRVRPLVYLGAISLSFYLWHLVIIDKVKEWTVPDYAHLKELAANPPPGNTLASIATFQGNYVKVVVIAWTLSFLIASVLFRFVETPFVRLKDAPLHHLWTRRRATPATTVTATAATSAGTPREPT
jgi:peptidoglycan/LPS O-acetylase OafA/YrhL